MITVPVESLQRNPALEPPDVYAARMQVLANQAVRDRRPMTARDTALLDAAARLCEWAEIEAGAEKERTLAAARVLDRSVP